MKFKANVIVIFNPTVQTIMDGWEKACHAVISLRYEPTVTSGMDGAHSLDSGHYYGRALDFRSSDIPFTIRANLVAAAQEILGPKYFVLLESDHIHIQRQKDSF